MEKTSSLRSRKNFTEHQRNVLKTWMLAHLDNPYPTPEEKMTLSRSTGLTIEQVEQFNINFRKRELKDLRRSRSDNLVNIMEDIKVSRAKKVKKVIEEPSSPSPTSFVEAEATEDPSRPNGPSFDGIEHEEHLDEDWSGLSLLSDVSEFIYELEAATKNHPEMEIVGLLNFFVVHSV